MKSQDTDEAALVGLCDLILTLSITGQKSSAAWSSIYYGEETVDPLVSAIEAVHAARRYRPIEWPAPLSDEDEEG